MMLLQIFFEIPQSNQDAFEALYTQTYVPALKVQKGYMQSNLLRIFPQEIAQEIDAAPTPFNYQMELIFDTEANRRLWVASAEHSFAWSMAESLASRVKHRAYDLILQDSNILIGD